MDALVKRQLGISIEATFGEDSYLSYDVRVAVNVNYQADAAVAEAIL